MEYFIYWNLHKGRWSVRAMSGPSKGLVVDRVERLTLRNVRGKVSEAGRQRVLATGRKNVHAGLIGEIVPDTDTNLTALVQSRGRQITYNPRMYDSFVYMDESRFDTADYAVLGSDRRVFAVTLDNNQQTMIG